MLLATFLLVLPPSQAPAQTARESAARQAIRTATLAVEGDSTAQVRRRWIARLPGDSVARLGLATTARLTYQWDDSDREYRALIPAGRPAGSPVEFQAVLGWSASLGSRQRGGEAVPQVRQVLEAPAASPATRAEALLLLAREAVRTGVDSAVRLLDRAGELAPESHPALRASQRCALGAVIRFRNVGRADSLTQEGIALAQAAGDLRAEGRCRTARAQVAQYQGRLQDSHRHAIDANLLLSRARDYEAYAVGAQWVAFLAVNSFGDYALARRMAAVAIARGTQSSNALAVAYAQLNLGQVGLRIGDVVVARRAAVEAESTFTAMNDRQGIANARAVIADAAYLAGDLPRARRAYQESDSLFRTLGINARSGMALRLAGIGIESGDLDGATVLVEESVRLATAQRVAGILNTDRHYYEGLLAMARGRFGDATTSFAEFRRGSGRGAFHYHVDADLRIAETLARAGNLDSALGLLRSGGVTIDVMRASLDAVTRKTESGSREALVTMLQGRRFDFDTDLGIATIVNLFARAGRGDDAFRIAEQERARYLLTALARRAAAISDSAVVAPGRMARLASRSVDLDSVRAALPPGTALLHFTTGRGGEPTTLITAWSGGRRVFTLTAADSLLDRIERLSQGLEGGQRLPALSAELGRLLVDSAIAVLPPGVNRLLIVPDGPLHRVPFDALHYAGGREVIERFAVSIAPSARIAVEPAVPARRAVVAAFGGAQFDAATKLPALPASTEEARVAAAAWPGGRAYLGARATGPALRNAVTGASILHLATHARVQDWGVMTSALYLTPTDQHDGAVSVSEIASLPLERVSLVVLSGCRTLGGPVVTGEGVQGLTAPFLEAGARAVVATWWKVGDRAAADFVKRFYDELRRGIAASDALRAAKRAAIRDGVSPAVWAAFALTGDGLVRFTAVPSGS